MKVNKVTIIAEVWVAAGESTKFLENESKHIMLNAIRSCLTPGSFIFNPEHNMDIVVGEEIVLEVMPGGLYIPKE